MPVTELLLLSIPAILLIFKLALLGLAVVWSIRAVLQPHGAPLAVRRQAPQMPAVAPLRRR